MLENNFLIDVPVIANSIHQAILKYRLKIIENINKYFKLNSK